MKMTVKIGTCHQKHQSCPKLTHLLLRFDTLKLFLLHICVIYGSIMSIVGIAVSISAVVTDSKNENLANNIEASLFLLQFPDRLTDCFVF